jgi:hypothetical protein
MIDISRRKFLGFLAAPAIIQVAAIMPIRTVEWYNERIVFDAGFYCPYIPLQMMIIDEYGKLHGDFNAQKPFVCLYDRLKN